MRLYNGPHQHWCGIDLHARTMYICIRDARGQIRLHENLRATPEAFLEAVAPYREGLVVAVECIYTWYWLADLCAREDRTAQQYNLGQGPLGPRPQARAGRLLHAAAQAGVRAEALARGSALSERAP